MIPENEEKIKNILKKLYTWAKEAKEPPYCCIDQAYSAILRVVEQESRDKDTIIEDLMGLLLPPL